MKLREEPGRAELIAYRRADSSEDRESRFRLVPVADPALMQAALADVLGIVAVVEKRRRLFLWRNVRIHIDEVRDLGDHIEFEAPIVSGSEAGAEELLRQLSDQFGIEDADRIASSYRDLMLSSSSGAAKKPAT